MRGDGRAVRRDALWWGLAVAGLVVWWAVIIGAPRLCAAKGGPAYAGAIGYLALGRVCHQDPSRCLWVAGAPLGVCARCAGIWGGVTLGVLLLPVVRGMSNRRIPHPRYLGLAAALVIADAGSEWLGLRGAIAWVRVATGGMLGLAAAWYVMPAILLALDERRRKGTGSCKQETRAVTT